MRVSCLCVLSVLSIALCAAPALRGQTTSPGGGTKRGAPPAAKETAPAARRGVDFDALSRAVTRSDAVEDLEKLYGQVFALREWHFIARGKFPEVHPYIASNARVAGGRHMVRAFTDTDRLMRFARENKLTGEYAPGKEEALILSMPTDKIIDYLEQFIPQGAYGVWFNSDSKSDGFFVPLKQLRPIKEHLENMRPRR